MQHPGIWQILRQDAASPSLGIEDQDPPLPLYEPFSSTTINIAPSPVISGVATDNHIRSLPSLPPTERAPSSSASSQTRSFLSMEPQSEGLMYTYSLTAGNAPIHVFISVEPEPEKQNHYTFSLSIKVGHVERALSKPITMRLSLAPRRLDFVVFAFPPRSSLPVGCLYNLRVWLRTSTGIDHRLFAENDLWIGKDPDFRSIGDASFAILRNATQDMLMYQALVGRAHVSFIVRWKLIDVGIYALSLDYDAGGAGRTLFGNYNLRLDCEPQTVSFVIYSIPVSSKPPGTTHRLRFWLRTPHIPPPRPPSPSPPHPTDTYLYHRLFKTDDFKLGAHLDFESLGTKAVFATRDHDAGSSSPRAAPTTWNPNFRNGFQSLTKTRLKPILVTDVSGERVNDR